MSTSQVTTMPVADEKTSGGTNTVCTLQKTSGGVVSTDTVPTCPPELSPGAATEFAAIVQDLQARGMIDRVDRRTIALYAVATARWKQAEAEILKTGPVVKGNAGCAISNPWLAVSRDAARQVERLGKALGLSGAARPSSPAATSPAFTDADFGDDGL